MPLLGTCVGERLRQALNRDTAQQSRSRQGQEYSSRVGWLEAALGGTLGATVPVMFLIRLGATTFNVALADAVIVVALGVIGLRLIAVARWQDLLRPVAVALGLFFGWLAVMSVVTLLRYDAIGIAAGHELFKYAVDLVWLIACSLVFSNRRARESFLGAWFVAAVFLSVATVATRLDAWPRYVRPEVTFQHPNALAHYLGASLGVAWWFTRGKARWLGWVGVALVLTGVFLTTSRGGLLASLATVAWIGTMIVSSRKGFRLRRLVIAGALAVLCAALLFLTPAGREFTGKLVGESHLTRVHDRLELWSDSLRFYRESPLLGMGPGMFARLQEEVLGKPGIIAHNEYLTALTEQGPVGLAALLFLLWTLLRISVHVAPRVPLATVGSAAVVHSAAHGFVSNVFQLRILWVGIALVLVAAWIAKETAHIQNGGSDTHSVPKIV